MVGGGGSEKPGWRAGRACRWKALGGFGIRETTDPLSPHGGLGVGGGGWRGLWTGWL